MPSNNLLKRSLLIAGITFSLAILVFLGQDLPARDPQTTPPAQSIGNNDAPRSLIGGISAQAIPKVPLLKKHNPASSFRLKIPKISIDAGVEEAGLTPEGIMSAPGNIANAAWFRDGPRPGQPGSSVINGHYGWQNGRPAVFNKLHELRPGDKIYVSDAQGATTTFIVRGSRTYSPNQDAAEVFNSHDNHAHLNLITCEGAWDEAAKSYSERLVVFTDKE